MSMNKKVFFLLALSMLSWQMLFAQEAKKRELRAAWIATVVNIDWPSKPGLSTQKQQEEYVALLDLLQDLGMNAVIVQVRPVADALYPSSYEPWSEYLSGSQGKAPSPYYNPLVFMIEQARMHNLEFHAWFNPYRASMKADFVHSADHPIHEHPEWFVNYGGKWYYDPGHPEAQEFVFQSIMETVKHYDLDAVHFDDYFYPYRIAGEEFPDSSSYANYGAEKFESIEDWRRNNVDFFVEELAKRIKAEKPHVKFGISPFGVWRNKDKDPMGSDTRAGQTNYDDLYADVLKWLREDWIDYITPQLYWHIGFDLADYTILADWWSKHNYGKHLYVGQGVYRVGQKGWEDPEEIVNQVNLNRANENIHGSMYFSAKAFTKNQYDVNERIKKVYKHKALVPTMPWMAGSTPEAPQLESATGDQNTGVRIEWSDDNNSQSAYYVVYRFNQAVQGDIEDPANIAAIVPRKPYAMQDWIDTNTNTREVYTYLITAVDRLHNESNPGNTISVKVRGWGRAIKKL